MNMHFKRCMCMIQVAFSSVVYEFQRYMCMIHVVCVCVCVCIRGMWHIAFVCVGEIVYVFIRKVVQ